MHKRVVLALSGLMLCAGVAIGLIPVHDHQDRGCGRPLIPTGQITYDTGPARPHALPHCREPRQLARRVALTFVGAGLLLPGTLSRQRRRSLGAWQP